MAAGRVVGVGRGLSPCLHPVRFTFAAEQGQTEGPEPQPALHLQL